MLEAIALRIATAAFLLCSLLINSVLPSPPSAPSEPSEPVMASGRVDAGSHEGFRLIGCWESRNTVYEFTESGTLYCRLAGREPLSDGDTERGTAMRYRLKDDTLTVLAEIGGEKREYTLTLEILGARVIRLGELTLYKTN